MTKREEFEAALSKVISSARCCAKYDDESDDIQALEQAGSSVMELYDEAAKDAERMRELLTEWRNTELDIYDEEFAPWLETFTAAVDAVLGAETEKA